MTRCESWEDWEDTRTPEEKKRDEKRAIKSWEEAQKSPEFLAEEEKFREKMQRSEERKIIKKVGYDPTSPVERLDFEEGE